ncbi:MAG: ABC transporter permease, partial [Janthinobacterium sp.]
TWPVSSMPVVLQWLRWLLPSTAGIQGFVALNQMGASLYEIRHEVSGLLALLLACVALGWWRWRKLDETVVDLNKAEGT